MPPTVDIIGSGDGACMLATRTDAGKQYTRWHECFRWKQTIKGETIAKLPKRV